MVKKTINQEKKKGYFRTIFSVYLESFKQINTEYFFYIFYDLLFLVIAGGLAYLMGYILQKFSGLADIVTLMQSADEAMQVGGLAQFKNTLIFTVVMFIALVFVMIILWSVIRTLIYNKIYNKKFTWKSMLKFVAANLVIIFLFLLLLSSIPIFIVQAKLPLLAGIVMLAMLYFVTIFYITFFRVGLFAKAFSETLNTAVIKFYKLVIPFVLLIITLLVAIGIFSFATSFLAAGASFAKLVLNVLTILVLLFLWSWARLYLVKAVNYVARKE